jgi:hypothetical protein
MNRAPHRWEVAENAHIARGGMDAQRAPLRIKAPLLARQRIDGVRKPLLGPGQRIRIRCAVATATATRVGPAARAQRLEQCVVRSQRAARKSSKSPSVPGSCASPSRNADCRPDRNAPSKVSRCDPPAPAAIPATRKSCGGQPVDEATGRISSAPLPELQQRRHRQQHACPAT